MKLHHEIDGPARGVVTRCALCLKSRDEVGALIGSEVTGAHVCNECVAVCDEILGRNNQRFELRPPAPPDMPPRGPHDCGICGSGPSMCCAHRIRRACPGCRVCQ